MSYPEDVLGIVVLNRFLLSLLTIISLGLEVNVLKIENVVTREFTVTCVATGLLCRAFFFYQRQPSHVMPFYITQEMYV